MIVITEIGILITWIGHRDQSDPAATPLRGERRAREAVTLDGSAVCLPRRRPDGDRETVHAKHSKVLRQEWVLKKSHREVAHSLGISAGAVRGLMVRTTARRPNSFLCLRRRES